MNTARNEKAAAVSREESGLLPDDAPRTTRIMWNGQLEDCEPSTFPPKRKRRHSISILKVRA